MDEHGETVAFAMKNMHNPDRIKLTCLVYNNSGYEAKAYFTIIGYPDWWLESSKNSRGGGAWRGNRGRGRGSRGGRGTPLNRNFGGRHTTDAALVVGPMLPVHGTSSTPAVVDGQSSGATIHVGLMNSESAATNLFIEGQWQALVNLFVQYQWQQYSLL